MDFLSAQMFGVIPTPLGFMKPSYVVLKIFSFYLEIVIRNSTISYPLFLYMVAAIFKIRIINENPWFSFHIPIEERVAVNFLNLLNSQNQTMGPGWYFSQKNGFN